MSQDLTKQTVAPDTTAQFDISALEVEGDLVNLTRLAKAANKRLDVWLKSDRTKRFLEAFIKVTPNGGIQIKLGRDKEQGTYAHRKVAIKFAEWVNVDFEVWVNQQLDTLLQTGKVELTSQSKSLNQLAREQANQVLALLDDIEAKDKLLAKKDETITSQNNLAHQIVQGKAVESRTMLKAVKDDLGVEINNLVLIIYSYIDGFREKHTQAHLDFLQATGIYYPGAKKASLETKTEYLNWLRRQKIEKTNLVLE